MSNDLKYDAQRYVYNRVILGNFLTESAQLGFGSQNSTCVMS